MLNNDLLNNLYKNCAVILDSLLNNDDPQYDRIILIGAHGTGKTTLANELSNIINMPVVESVAREVQKNIRYLENNDIIDVANQSKNYLANTYQNVFCSMSRWDFMRWVDAKVPCIMTRCPLDTIAYAYADDYVCNDIAKTNKDILRESAGFMEAIKRSLFIYIPIEFGIENDGVRPTDVEFQKHVDEYIRKLIYDFEITPLVVTGSVEERLKTILTKIYGSDISDILMENYMDKRV